MGLRNKKSEKMTTVVSSACGQKSPAYFGGRLFWRPRLSSPLPTANRPPLTQVLVFTLERGQHARITQAHFDSKKRKLVLRQSRHLDLQGPEPTEDAFLLLRWMTCRPAGLTEYMDEEEEEKEVRSGQKRKPPPGVSPPLALGCA